MSVTEQILQCETEAAKEDAFSLTRHLRSHLCLSCCATPAHRGKGGEVMGVEGYRVHVLLYNRVSWGMGPGTIQNGLRRRGEGEAEGEEGCPRPLQDKKSQWCPIVTQMVFRAAQALSWSLKCSLRSRIINLTKRVKPPSVFEPQPGKRRHFHTTSNV